MKKWLIALVFVFLSQLASALPNPVITITPISVYEYSTTAFNITVNNFMGNEVITQMEADTTGFNVINVTYFSNWGSIIDVDNITWTGSSIPTNVLSALFQFTARAPAVLANETRTWLIKSTGASTQIDFFTISLLNDDTPPALTNERPTNGTYIRNSANYLVSVNATDPETGIDTSRISFSWHNCTDPNNLSDFHVQTLSCTNDICASAADFSTYAEGLYVCYNFTAYNNGNGSSAISGRVGFDTLPPAVEIYGPQSNAYLSGLSQFTFNATDNLASALSCNLTIDSAFANSITAGNNTLTNISYNVSQLSEGAHLWDVRCIDNADYVGLSATRGFIVDKTAPSITLIWPSNSSLVAGSIAINVSVTDNYELESVAYSQPLNISSWAKGKNNLTVTALDKAGNLNTAMFTFTKVIDYNITLNLSPNPVEPAQTLNVFGHVLMEDGTTISENYATLIMPEEKRNVSIANNSFYYAFNAPGWEEAYYVTAMIFAGNNYTYNMTEMFVVDSEDDGNDNRRRDRGGGGVGRGNDNEEDEEDQEQESPVQDDNDQGADEEGIDLKGIDADSETEGNAITGLVTFLNTFNGRLSLAAAFAALTVLFVYTSAIVGKSAALSSLKSLISGAPKPPISDGEWRRYFNRIK